MTRLSRHWRGRRLLVGDALLGLFAVAVVVMALPAAQALPPTVTAAYSTSSGSVVVSVGASIPDAVNTADDGKFVQLAPAATITLAFPAGTYAAPDGTGAVDLTVHTFDAAYPASAEVQVFVKSNTNDWVSLGTNVPDTADVGFNLEGVGLVNEVKIVQNGPIDPAYPDLGFDLDAVTAANYVTLTETCNTVTPGVYTPNWAYQSRQFASAVGSGAATPVMTFGALTNGVGYRFEAKGLYSAGPAGGPGTEILADARYSQRVVGQATPGDLVLGYEGFGPTLLDLLLDGGAADWQGAAFNGDHAYTADRVGNGLPAEFDFQVSELYADNNVGGICVSLYKDAVGPMTTGVAVNPSMVKVGSTAAITATVDDTGKGDSWIQAAEWKVNGSPGPFAMTPMTALDSKVEAFTADFASVPAGVHEICVRGQDKAGNWGDWSCVDLKVYDRWAKISGVVVGTSGATSSAASLNVPTDKGEPDYAFDGYAYAGGSNVWGSVAINYKSVTGGPVNCTFTPGQSGLFASYGSGERPRVDLLGWAATCSNGTALTISIQLVPRDTTAWGGITVPSRAQFPRGGVFLNTTPYVSFTGTFDLYSGYTPFDLWVPLDRGNVHTWADASVPRS